MARRTSTIIRRMRGVTVRRRGRKWLVFTNHNGKRKAKAFAKKDDANTFARKIEEGLKKATWNLALLDWKLPGAVESKPAMTFGQYAEAYLAAKEPNAKGEGPLKFSTWRDYAGTVRLHLRPVLGDKALAGISRDDIKALPAALRRRNRTAHVIRKAVRTLSAILSEAVEEKLMPVNPALGIKWKGELRTPQRPIIPPTAEELCKVLATARDYQIQRGGQTVYPYRRHYAFILLTAHTGLRLGEALALKLGDIDWTHRRIHVQRAWVRGRLTSPKSRQLRVVDLDAAAFAMLQAMRDERFPNKIAALDAEEQARMDAERARAMFDAWVFPNAEGHPIDAHKWRRRVWYPLLLKAGLRHVRIHDLRHGFATFLLNDGVSPYYVQAMLGHHSADFTVRTYGHRPQGDHRGVDRLTALVPEPVADQLQILDHQRADVTTSDQKNANNLVAATG